MVFEVVLIFPRRRGHNYPSFFMVDELEGVILIVVVGDPEAGTPTTEGVIGSRRDVFIFVCDHTLFFLPVLDY